MPGLQELELQVVLSLAVQQHLYDWIAAVCYLDTIESVQAASQDAAAADEML